MHSVTEEQLSQWRQLLTGYESEIQEALDKVERLKPIVTHLSALIHALDTDSGNKVDAAATAPQFPFDRPAPSESMPAKRSRFKESTILDAEVAVLRERGKAMHADDITREIFEIKTPHQFYAAKRTVVSELLRRALPKGLAKRAAGKNMFEASPAFRPTTLNGSTMSRSS